MSNEDFLLFLLRTTAFKTPVEVLAGRESDQMTSNRKTILNLVNNQCLDSEILKNRR